MPKRVKRLFGFIVGVLLLNGCATVQLMEKFFLKSPPSVIVIGDITPANEKVSLSLEKVEQGRKILFETFKKELPFKKGHGSSIDL